MKRSLVLLSAVFLLAACVDTTGISPNLSKPPKGNPAAVLTVSEYADLECPACKRAHEILTQPLIQKYGSQIRFEYHHFPLRSLHRFTMDLAEGAECAADQGTFWEFVDIAFTRQDQLKAGIVSEWAKELGLDMDLFERCTDSHIKRDAVMAEYEEGVARGVQGTPTFYVGDKQVQATIEELSNEIDLQLKTAGQRL